MQHGMSVDFDEVQKLQGAQKGLTERIEIQKRAVKDLNVQYAENQSTISNYAKLEEDVLNGHVENINKDLSLMKENFVTAENGTKEILLRQTMEFQKTYETLKQQAQVEGSGVTDAMVQNYQDMYYESAVELQKFTGMSMTEIGELINGINSKNEDFAAAGTQNGKSYTAALEEAINNASGSIYNTAQSIANKISNIISNASINANVSANFGGAPKTATGGIVTRAQTRIVGEDGAEAIVPLEKNTKWIDLVAAKILGSSGFAVLSGAMSQNHTVNNYFTQNNTSPKALSRLEIYRQSRNLLEFKGR